jgi:hypothetical protein
MQLLGQLWMDLADFWNTDSQEVRLKANREIFCIFSLFTELFPGRSEFFYNFGAVRGEKHGIWHTKLGKMPILALLRDSTRNFTLSLFFNHQDLTING